MCVFLVKFEIYGVEFILAVANYSKLLLEKKMYDLLKEQTIGVIRISSNYMTILQTIYRSN